MSHFSTAYLTDLKTQEPSVYEVQDADNQSRTSNFHGVDYFFSDSNYSTKLYCPYSIRESQQSMEYKYDVLLLYDPDENSYFVDKLMEHLIPQNLKIFDFLRDSPPGMPQRKVLHSALKFCRYTCLIITRKFLTNFWSQLKADMSIQDMLDNEEKLYSVIVVVMDLAVKREALPLDLATLSPLFCSEKFFENRLKLAFSKSSFFPSNNSFSVNTSAEVNSSQLSTAMMQSQSSLPSMNKPNGCTDAQSMSRIPREHGDNLFISSLPVSIFNIHAPASSVMHRANSITVSSTGNRQPTESSDITSCEENSLSLPCNLESQNNSLEDKDHECNVKYPLECVFAADNFSYSSSDHQEASPIASQSYKNNHITEVNRSLASDLSELEISLDTPSASMALVSSNSNHDATTDEEENSLNNIMSELEISVGSETSPGTPSSSCVLEKINNSNDMKVDATEKGHNNSMMSELEISISSYPGDFAKPERCNEAASICENDFRERNELQLEGQCMSLPADTRSPAVKKSSLMDLVRGRFVRIRKSMSFRHRRDKQSSS